MSQIKIFNDPVHGFIEVRKNILFALINHPYIQRLRYIRQLGLSSIVYSGATHTRFSHALGSLFLTQEALKTLINKGIEISEEEQLATQIAILLHDIGHGPFSHALESVLVPSLRHEQMSRALMLALNDEFEGQLSMAIDIFEGNYPKYFLSQLIAGQLDMDRMDYLMRDSYFTGVVEGAIGAMRIIKTLNVHNNRLVVEEKGINSVEKFIVARRLMYWQVYLHKTALAAECMLIRILQRARSLIQNGVPLFCQPNLRYFMEQEIAPEALQANDTLQRFTALDDADILFAIKEWQNAPDFILRELCQRMRYRRLLKLKYAKQPFSIEEIDAQQKACIRKYRLPLDEINYLVFSGRVTNLAYVNTPKDEPILILLKNGSVTDLLSASDSQYFRVTGETIIKHYLCFPGETL